MTKLLLGLAIPIFLLLVSNAYATDESLYNGERGIEGKIFCDIQYQEEDTKSGCYDRNDTPDQYCDKYAQIEESNWFCESVCSNYEEVIARGEHCDNK